jgi:hypothetical protein
MIDSEEYRLGLLCLTIIIPEYLNSISIHIFNWRIYYSSYVTLQSTQIKSKASSPKHASHECYKKHTFAK